jgi:hypothetical protein
MNPKTIPDEAILQVASQINQRSNKAYPIPIVGHAENPETPQIFEILPFDQIDNTDTTFFAIDGSYNSQEFYNGLCVAMYTAGYVAYRGGVQLKLNDLDDPIILGKSYAPCKMLITHDGHKVEIYDELLSLEPVKAFMSFLGDSVENIFAYNRDTICSSTSTLLGFAQEILEWSLVHEIGVSAITKSGDFILRDGTLRSLHIKQRYLVKLGHFLHDKGIRLLAVTKNSPIKLELAYTFKQIDAYLQDKLKPNYTFKTTDPARQKLCCWFEVPDAVLAAAYSGNLYVRKETTGGRGCGLFFAARLDYVEKLQNYDWLVVDVNLYDAIPGIDKKNLTRDTQTLVALFLNLTRLTQEHYILGYPYPLVEAHNFVSIKKEFKDEVVKRVKFALYHEQQMDNVDIENLFLDIHDRF